MSNMSFDTDAQVHPCASRTRVAAPVTFTLDRSRDRKYCSNAR
jgi:hypothetical protein